MLSIHTSIIMFFFPYTIIYTFSNGYEKRSDIEFSWEMLKLCEKFAVDQLFFFGIHLNKSWQTELLFSSQIVQIVSKCSFLSGFPVILISNIFVCVQFFTALIGQCCNLFFFTYLELSAYVIL